MARNVHALVAGKIDPRNLKLAFVAPIAAIAHSDRPRLSRQAGTGILRHRIRLKRRARLLRPKDEGARIGPVVMNLTTYIGIAGLKLTLQIHVSGRNLSKLCPTRIRKIGVADQNNVTIGAMCELKHVEGNL